MCTRAKHTSHSHRKPHIYTPNVHIIHRKNIHLSQVHPPLNRKKNIHTAHVYKLLTHIHTQTYTRDKHTSHSHRIKKKKYTQASHAEKSEKRILDPRTQMKKQKTKAKNAHERTHLVTHTHTLDCLHATGT